MRFIAFLDILGFKDLIENNKLEEVISFYKEAFNDSYYNSFWIFQNLKEMEREDAIINSIVVSDSIILWSDEANYNSFVKMLFIVNGICYSFFKRGLPLRGGIDIGRISEISIDEIERYNVRKSPIILGKGLTDAYQLENKQQWAGCIISDQTIKAVTQLLNGGTDILEDLEFKVGLILRYKVPFKTGTIKEYFVVNWPYYFSTSPSDEWIRQCFDMYNKRANNWDVETKILNTIRFVNYSLASKSKNNGR